MFCPELNPGILEGTSGANGKTLLLDKLGQGRREAGIIIYYQYVSHRGYSIKKSTSP
jgi:hypothetical protein